MRFLHVADVHLGNQQYNLSKRFNDFGKAFADACQLAIDEQVDAFVIAGDLFHKASVEPLTLLQAEAGLRELADRGIKVIAVHGNHDKARYLAQVSWLEYLSQRDLMYLLSPDFVADPLELVPDISYVDIKGVRFIGVPWLGASAPRTLAEVAGVMDHMDWTDINFTVLVTHAGIEDQMVGMPGSLSHAELLPLKGKVQYLATGHFHKPYESDWIYSPGSLETCSFDEENYKRGAYLVDVHTDGTHSAKHMRTIMRPFFTIWFDTNAYLSPEDLNEAVFAQIGIEAKRIAEVAKGHPDPGRATPVVRLVLTGNLSFDRMQLNLEALRDRMREEIDALYVRVENKTTPLGLDAAPDQDLGRAELEQAVFQTLVKGNSQFSADADTWANLARELKVRALESAEPAEMFALIDRVMSDLEGAEHVDH